MSAFPRYRIRTCAALLGGALLSACATVTAPATPVDAIDEKPRTSKEKATEAPRIFSNDQDAVGALNGNDIRMLVWNVHKASSDAWIGDFRTLSADSNLVLLQEAHMHEEFSQGLVGLPRWDMVDAWEWRSIPTGVLTASSAEPLRVQALEHREPVLRTDKSALITEYRIAGSSQTLLVANVHAINFTADTRAFHAQLLAVADALDEHEGPVILSGDFNTWRAERRAIVEDIAAELDLDEVPFDGPRRQFRQFPLDHVFYRGLELVSHDVTEVDSSDHNPLQVTFRRHPSGVDIAPIVTGALN